MSVFKQFLSQDVIVTPFEVNKSFAFTGAASLISSSVSIDRFIGTNITGNFSPTEAQTGYIATGSYQRCIYNSIKTLYYTNFISSSKGDEATKTVIDNGVILEINNNQPRFENYLQTTLTQSRSFPTASNAQLGVISIPSKLFGEQIQPKSISILYNSNKTITDDGEGNLLLLGNKIGNIIYPHGILIITDSSYYSDIITTNDINVSFNSTYTIHETQYKCTIRESEFNYSQNSSIVTGSYNDTVLDFVTGSNFSPYITTIGLYNDRQELLAVAKMAQPLPSSRTTDMNIIINIDR
jgi:hypothetical protein